MDHNSQILSIVTSVTGEITGYGLSIEAEITGEPVEIAAAITTSLEMLRQTIASQIAVAAPQSATADDPPPGYAPAEPPSGSPLTPDEAERRFFSRYGEIIGGQEWEAVNRYLHRRSAKPTTTRSGARRCARLGSFRVTRASPVANRPASA